MASGFCPERKLAGLALALAVLLAIAHPSSTSPASPPPPGLNNADRNITTSHLNITLSFVLIYGVIPFFAALGFLFLCYICKRGPKRTVLSVKVVLSAGAGDVGIELRDIFRATGRSGTESIAEWKKRRLQGITRVLFGHQNSFIYGSTSVEEKRGRDYANTLAIGAGVVMKEVRLKFGREYLPNCRPLPNSDVKLGRDYTVVTVMVLADGVHKLPLVESREDVRQALNYLETKVPQLMDMRLVWAYQDPFLIQKLLVEYPNLNSLLV